MTPATGAVQRRVLLVERLGGPLNALTPFIQQFGYEVVRAADVHAVGRLITTLRRLSLMIVNGGAVKTEAGRFVGTVKAHQPDVPILWFVDAGSGPVPSKLDFSCTDLEKMQARITRIVREGFYSPSLVQKIIEGAQAVLSEFAMPTKASEPCVKSSLTTLGETNALLFFRGRGLAGHTVITSSLGDLAHAYRLKFPKAHSSPGQDDLEDFLGEVANQVVGQFKRFIRVDGTDFTMGLPHFIRGSGAAFRYKAGTPTLAVDFSNGVQRLSLEVCMHRFDGETLQASDDDHRLTPGVLTYL